MLKLKLNEELTKIDSLYFESIPYLRTYPNQNFKNYSIKLNLSKNLCKYFFHFIPIL